MKVIDVDVSKLLSDMGMHHCENQEYDEALKYFNDGLEYDSENIMLLYNKACCLLFMEQIDKAVPIFENVVELSEKSEKTESILSVRASSLIFLNNLDELEVTLKELLEINPDNIDALTNYGQILNHNGDYDEALKNFNKVLEIDDKNEHALISKAEVLFELSRYDESRECMDQALEVSKNNPYIWYMKGRYESDVLSNYELAVEYFDRALEIEANFEKSIYEKMICLTILGKSKEAKETFHKYADLHPEDYDAERLEVSDRVIDIMVSNFASK